MTVTQITKPDRGRVRDTKCSILSDTKKYLKLCFKLNQAMKI